MRWVLPVCLRNALEMPSKLSWKVREKEFRRERECVTRARTFLSPLPEIVSPWWWRAGNCLGSSRAFGKQRNGQLPVSCFVILHISITFSLSSSCECSINDGGWIGSDDDRFAGMLLVRSMAAEPTGLRYLSINTALLAKQLLPLGLSFNRTILLLTLRSLKLQTWIPHSWCRISSLPQFRTSRTSGLTQGSSKDDKPKDGT